MSFPVHIDTHYSGASDHVRPKRKCTEIDHEISRVVEKRARREELQSPSEQLQQADLGSWRSLSIAQQASLLPHLREEEISEVLDRFTVRNLNSVFFTFDPSTQLRVVQQISDSKLLRWVQSISKNRLCLISVHFNMAQIEFLFTNLSGDQIKKLLMNMSAEVKAKLQNEYRTLTFLNHGVSPLTHRHIAYVFSANPENIPRYFEQVDKMSEEQLDLIFLFGNRSNLIHFLPFAHPRQIRETWPSFTTEETLHDLLGKLRKDQLREVVGVMPKWQRDAVAEPVNFTDIDLLITKRRLSRLVPYILAIAMQKKSIFTNLVRYSEKFTIEQAETIAATLSIKNLIEFYSNCSSSQREAIASGKEQNLIDDCVAYAEKYPEAFSSKLKEHSSDLQGVQQELRLMKSRIIGIDSQEACDREARKFSGIRLKLTRTLEWLKQQEMTLELFRAVIEKDDEYKEIDRELAKTKREIHQLFQTHFNITKANSISFQLEVARRKLRESEPDSDVLIRTDETRIENLDELYENAMQALSDHFITGEDLDRYELSWEDIIEAGIQSSYQIESHGITEIESIAEFIRAGNRVRTQSIWERFLGALGVET